MFMVRRNKKKCNSSFLRQTINKKNTFTVSEKYNGDPYFMELRASCRGGWAAHSDADNR